MKKDFYKYECGPLHPITSMDWKRRRIIEQQKERCRKEIRFHKQNVILQGIISFLCVAGSIYAGQKRSILVPLVLAPMAAASCSNLAKHEATRRHRQKILEELERE